MYLSSGVYLLAQANTGTTAAVAGIALNNAANGQPLAILSSGSITIGATVVVGGVYALAADNPGAICPVADVLSTGDYITILGVAPNSTTINLTIQVSGVAHA